MQNLNLNLEMLRTNLYPGRGIMIGRNQNGMEVHQILWTMGRREPSRNRVLSKDDEGRVFTEPADPSKITDPAELKNIIYTGMRENGTIFVVGNGNQTDTVIDKMQDGQSFQDALSLREYEDDEPNFTPRITGIYSLRSNPSIQLSILKRSSWGNSTDRFLFPYDDIGVGVGVCLTTYQGDGNPLPSFVGEPLHMILEGSAEKILETYWNALNEENRVSMAIKSINSVTGRSRILIKNKYTKVG